jgi:hypothetical protein
MAKRMAPAPPNEVIAAFLTGKGALISGRLSTFRPAKGKSIRCDGRLCLEADNSVLVVFSSMTLS